MALVRLGFEEDEIADEPEPEPEAIRPDGTTADGKKAKAPKDPKKAESPENPTAKNVKNADIEPSSLSDILQSHLEDLLKASQGSALSALLGDPWEMDVKPSKGLVLRASAVLHDAAIQGADEAMMQTPKTPATSESYEKPALKFAREQAAEMVGMKWDGDKLIPNPNPKWQISDMCRDAIRSTVARAIEEGWTPAKLSETLSADHAFSPARALTIARDQLAQAQEAGSFAYFKAAGVTGKRWSALDACPVCEANAAQGVIPLDKPFQSGHMHGPAHPNDRCRILPEEMPE